MAKSITFTIADDAVALRIRNSVCNSQGYMRNRLSSPNPSYDDQIPDDEVTNNPFIYETKNEFFRRVTLNWWASRVALDEERAAHQARVDEVNGFDITSSEV